MEKIDSNIDENEKINFLFTISQIQQHSGTPVSYTHLDVYKRQELCRRPAQMMVYPAPLEDMVKLAFAENKWGNRMEFLVSCEK